MVIKRVTFLQYIRAFRLEFTLCSALPYVCGSLLPRDSFQWGPFVLGFIAVVFTHLSANLMNDYADSKTGVDWSDVHFYKFFGGSKMIQQGLLSETWYLKASFVCAGIAVSALMVLFVLLRNPLVLVISFTSLLLGWMYSHKPFALSHRRIGEVVIFLLFGLVPFGAGYYLQSGIIFPSQVFYASLPYGFLITAILFANEIPDFSSDVRAKKYTWVSITKPKKAFILYSALHIAALFSIIICIMKGIFPLWTLVSVLCMIPAVKAMAVMKEFSQDKERLLLSSKITIVEHTLVGIILLLGSI